MSKQAALEKIEAMQTAKKPRRTAQEQALAPLIKRRDSIKKRWDEADADALRKHRDKYGPEHEELDAMIKAIEGVSGDE